MDAAAVFEVGLFVAMALRYAIVGERFDRRLHQVDPTYLNLRDIGRRLLLSPRGALRDLPRSYGRWYGIAFRPVPDPEVERLRRRALRAFFDVGLAGVAGLVLVGALASVQRRFGPGGVELFVIASQGVLGLYWLRRLRDRHKDPTDSALITIFIVIGIAVAAGCIVLVALTWGRPG